MQVAPLFRAAAVFYPGVGERLETIAMCREACKTSVAGVIQRSVRKHQSRKCVAVASAAEPGPASE
jgi:hypothetical protein